MRKHAILGSALMVVGVLGLASGVASASSDHAEGGANRITICHATASDTNPYRLETVDDDSIFKQGHDQHAPGGRADIIPPFEYTDEGVTATYGGRSWDGAGQEIWNNGCQVPAPTTEPPTTEPPTTEPPTTEPPFVPAPNVHLTYLCEQDGTAKWRARNNGDVDGTYRIVREGTGEVLWQGTIQAGGTFRFTDLAADGVAHTVIVQRLAADGSWEQAGPKASEVEGDVACESTATEPPTTEPPATEPPATTPEQLPATVPPQPSVEVEATAPASLPETGPGAGTVVVTLAGLASLAGGLTLMMAGRRHPTV